MDFILTREPIKITSMRGYMGEKMGMPGKVWVVRIKNFLGTTSDTVWLEIEDLKKKGVTSFDLDLWVNPGGPLPSSMDTASLFLEADRVVVYVVNKNGVVDAQRMLTNGIDLTLLLMLLVKNGNTASAAKVMTAVLRENSKRAVLAGEKTFLLRRAKAKLRGQQSGSCDRQRQPWHYPTIIWLACRFIYRGRQSWCHRGLRVRGRNIKEVVVTNS